MAGDHIMLCGVMLVILQGEKRILITDRCKDLVQGNNFITRPPVAAERHEFNKANLDRNMCCPGNEIVYFIIIKTLHYHHINFYIEVVMQQQLNIASNTMKQISSCDQHKLIRLQCVKTYIN